MRGISCIAAPIRDHTFFEQPDFEGLLGDDLFQFLRFAPEVLDVAGVGGPLGVTGQAALAGFEELLRPAVVETFGDAFATAQFGDRRFAAQAVEDDTDLLFGGECRRVARRMSLTSRSADDGSEVPDFCLICAP